MIIRNENVLSEGFAPFLNNSKSGEPITALVLESISAAV